MRRRYLVSSLLFSATLAFQGCAGEPAGAPGTEPPAPPPGAAQAAPSQNVILICWDGLDRSVLKELLDAEKLPNLATVVKAGSLQDVDVMGHDTETRPGHAEMLTGLSADDNGIRSNAEGDNVPEGTTIFEILKKRFGRDGIATVMITGKSYVGTVVSPEGRERLDTCDIGSRFADDVGPRCLAAVEKHKARRFFAFFHFLDPDNMGHNYGSDSAEYRQAAVTCDKWLGALLEQLKKEKLADSTLIYVMADHGFDKAGRTHTFAPHSWLATNDKGVSGGGRISDVTATILARFGVDISALKPRLLGRPLLGKPEPAPAPTGAGAPAPAVPVPEEEPVPVP